MDNNESESTQMMVRSDNCYQCSDDKTTPLDGGIYSPTLLPRGYDMERYPTKMGIPKNEWGRGEFAKNGNNNYPFLTNLQFPN